MHVERDIKRGPTAEWRPAVSAAAVARPLKPKRPNRTKPEVENRTRPLPFVRSSRSPPGTSTHIPISRAAGAAAAAAAAVLPIGLQDGAPPQRRRALPLPAARCPTPPPLPQRRRQQVRRRRLHDVRRLHQVSRRMTWGLARHGPLFSPSLRSSSLPPVDG